jgi:hypothetical protein
MKISPEMNFALTIISGLCWTMVYILIIYRSIKDKTYGMPFWALAFNINWEFIFSAIFVSHKPEDFTQLVVNHIWLVFDIVIVVCYFLYGKKDWPQAISKALFYPYSLIVLITAFLFVYLFSVTFHSLNGMYMAFIQNMMMSWLFIVMLLRRNSLAGQSTGIAIFKMLGTLAPTILYGLDYPFVLFLGACCFIADCIYVVMVLRFTATDIRNW